MLIVRSWLCLLFGDSIVMLVFQFSITLHQLVINPITLPNTISFCLNSPWFFTSERTKAQGVNSDTETFQMSFIHNDPLQKKKWEAMRNFN